MEDTKSKFGTLVQVKRPVVLDINDPLTFQIGRSLITIDIKKPWSLIPACFRQDKRQFDLYNMTVNPNEPMLMPINTGIPLSCADVKALTPFATGMKPQNPENMHSNLLHNHNQLGQNSSCEEQSEQNSLEEVEVYMPTVEAENDELVGEDPQEVMETWADMPPTMEMIPDMHHPSIS